MRALVARLAAAHHPGCSLAASASAHHVRAPPGSAASMEQPLSTSTAASTAAHAPSALTYAAPGEPLDVLQLAPGAQSAEALAAQLQPDQIYVQMLLVSAPRGPSRCRRGAAGDLGGTPGLRRATRWRRRERADEQHTCLPAFFSARSGSWRAECVHFPVGVLRAGRHQPQRHQHGAGQVPDPAAVAARRPRARGRGQGGGGGRAGALLTDRVCVPPLSLFSPRSDQRQSARREQQVPTALFPH